MTYSYFKSFLFFLFFTGVQVSGFSQIEFSLNLMADSSTWAVYARANSTINPSDNIQLSVGAQTTIVASSGVLMGTVISVNGIWTANVRENSPLENPGFDYISFGYFSSFPIDAFVSGEPVLLFTFTTLLCPESLALMDHGDPFLFPNSQSTNPGNACTIVDITKGLVYEWTDNYVTCDWSCETPCTPDERDISNTEKIQISPISVFPNPTNGIINFENEKQDLQNIIVRNLYGQSVFQQNQPSQQIDLSHLPSGSYFVFFENEKALTQTKRIIIQK